MNQLDCSICLDTIKPEHKYTLSCNHSFHYQCFLSCVFYNESHIFIICPLCREMNYNNERLHKSDLENIKEISKIKRCCHKTKSGKMCKNKCHILNYGYCYTHNKNVLPKERYKLMCDFIYWTLETSNYRKTKILMIDIAKKLMILKPELKTIQDIQHYFFRYYHYNDKIYTVDPNGLYHYYDLEIAPEEWLKKCLEKKIFM
jgi:hypothetical protein